MKNAINNLAKSIKENIIIYETADKAVDLITEQSLNGTITEEQWNIDTEPLFDAMWGAEDELIRLLGMIGIDHNTAFDMIHTKSCWEKMINLAARIA